VTPISLTINGEPIDGSVEPRTHLADFLREQCDLTGTHLGCEQGVCGACTVLLDGEPVRACITYAVTCRGASVETIEGFRGDALMARLRDAFTREHALQCGFCTPGMLIAAYDIVRRLGAVDETRIRTELAGNLCRCTGYMGIVAAIRRVMAEGPPRREPAAAPPVPQPVAAIPAFTPLAAEPSHEAALALASDTEEPLEPGWSRVGESFAVELPPGEVWRLFLDAPRMAACMPGASLDEHDERNLKGRFRVRLGPIAASFAGAATIERDERRLAGRLSGGGREEKGASQAAGRVAWRLTPLGEDGAATRVDVTFDFRLQGMLAQFGRIGIVRDLIGRTVAEFARNLAASIEAGDAAPAPAAELRAGRLVSAALREKSARIIGRLLKRGEPDGR